MDLQEEQSRVKENGNPGGEKEWNDLFRLLKKQFGEDLDMQGLLFLIGLQETGKTFTKLNKDQKLDVMHVAICTLLEPFGYYIFEGTDADGWPHWKNGEKLPYLKANDQEKLMKEALLDYFKKNGTLT